jgi:hypothetical protein
MFWTIDYFDRGQRRRTALFSCEGSALLFLAQHQDDVIAWWPPVAA